MTSSRKPNKQRRALYKAPLHVRGKQFNARLEDSIAEQYNIKRLPIRINDSVRVMRGQFRDLEGKVLRVDRKKYKVILEEVTREKADGSIHYYPLHPSKLLITKLGDIDKWRQKIIDRRNRDLYSASVEEQLPAKGKTASKSKGKR
ncbi:MAG: 50S ribosomal protein L24 [Promethearchaeota archaeon]